MFATIKSSFNKMPNPRALLAFRRSFAANSKNIAIAINDKTGIATVTMQRAPVNTLSKEFLTQLGNTFEHLEKERCKGIILTSAMKVFSAGLDFNEFNNSTEEIKDFLNSLYSATVKLYQTSVPTVSLVNGNAPGAGCLLALIAQYRIMLKHGRIGYIETQFGLVLPRSFIYMFENVVGAREAEKAACLGKLYSSEEALRVGLVDEVVEDASEGLERAEKFLLKFQKVDANAARITKLLCRERVIEEYNRNTPKEVEHFSKLITDPEIQKVVKEYIKSIKSQRKQ